MKTNPGSLIKLLVLAGLVAGSGILTASAYAAPADRTGNQPRCEAYQLQRSEASREGRRTAHLAELKEKLKLSAGQEAAWNTFVAQRNPRHPGIDRKAMRDEFEKLSTPERLDRMQAMMDMRRARLAERAVATKAFYAQLSPEQQRVFDAETMLGGHHGGDYPRHHQS